jgi:aminoglycoside phosphotransferase
VEQDRVARPKAWVLLELAVMERRRVRLRYHGTDRVVCPHVLGWKNGRAKALLFQVAVTGQGAVADSPREHWRSMFVDEIEDAVVVEGNWETAENFSLSSNCVEVVGVAVRE